MVVIRCTLRIGNRDLPIPIHRPTPYTQESNHNNSVAEHGIRGDIFDRTMISRQSLSHVVIQDEQASLATPDRRQLGHFSSERPLAAVDCIQDFSGCDGCEKGRR